MIPPMDDWDCRRPSNSNHGSPWLDPGDPDCWRHALSGTVGTSPDPHGQRPAVTLCIFMTKVEGKEN